MEKSKIKSPTASEQKRFSMTVSDVLGWKWFESLLVKEIYDTNHDKWDEK